MSTVISAGKVGRIRVRVRVGLAASPSDLLRLTYFFYKFRRCWTD